MQLIRRILLLLPLVELALLIVLGALIGAGPTFLVIVATGILGALLLSLSRRAQMPGQPGLGGMSRFAQGGATSISGFLLLVPGVLTDLLGLVLLIPGPRRWILEGFQRWLFKRLTGMDVDQMPTAEDLGGFGGFGGFGPGPGPGPGGPPPRPGPGTTDGPPLIVDAEVTAVRDDPS